MNKIIKNIIRYGLIFMALMSIYYVDGNASLVVMLAFCIGYILSQSIKDIESYFNLKVKAK